MISGSYNYDKYHYGYDDSSDDSDSTVYSEVAGDTIVPPMALLRFR